MTVGQINLFAAISGSDDQTGCGQYGYNELLVFFQSIARKQAKRSKIVFICIGTDRSTGDAFGPLVGTMLKELGWTRVIGTLEEPCDAHSVVRAAALPGEGDTIIAIDACLGHPKSIGKIVASEGSLQPGKAIGRNLPPIGHYSIAGIVNMNGPKAYWKLQTTSLHLVMRMAQSVASAATDAWQSMEAETEAIHPLTGK